jgi:hypothetical protein
MTTLKITNKIQEADHIRIFFSILKDGEVFSDGQSLTVTPLESDDEIKDKLRAIKRQYADAEDRDKQLDSLIGIEL